MKRFIKATACTLVLSLFIAFGVNQNSISLGKVFDTNSNTTKVEENVTNKEALQSLPSDDQTKVAAIATETTDTDIKEETPDSSEDFKAINLETTNTNDNSTNNGFTQVSTKKAVTKATSKKAIKNSNKNNFSTINGQVLMYKNVNLSQCNSTKDVVQELQKNGYTNINMKNIKNIKSLKNILSIIRNSESTGTTPTPTVKPVPTTKPTPTAAPAPTTKPTPTTAPAPTTKPTPTTAPTPTVKPTAPSNNSGISGYAQEVLRLVNIERQKAGLTPYTTNSTLTAAANKRAQETKQSFSHTRPNGTGFQTVLNEYGISYKAAGENIAYGQRSPQEVVTGWMNSPGHRANILNAKFNKLGIGVYQSSGTIYWAQEFTN